MFLKIRLKEFVQLYHYVSLFAVFFSRKDILVVVNGYKDYRGTYFVEPAFQIDVVAYIVEIKQGKLRDKLGGIVPLFGSHGGNAEMPRFVADGSVFVFERFLQVQITEKLCYMETENVVPADLLRKGYVVPYDYSLAVHNDRRGGKFIQRVSFRKI